MSGTRKDRNNQRRIVKNSLLIKTLKCYGEDIVGKRKDRTLNRKMRARLKRLSNKETLGGKL